MTRTVGNGATMIASMSSNASAVVRAAALGARLDKVGLPQATEVIRSVRAVPTIFPWVDCVLGVGGWPTDRFGIVHGPSNNGKTAFVIGQCKSFVQVGHPSLYQDAERTTANSGDWVASLMGDLVKSPLFRLKKPDSYEEIVDNTRRFCETIGDAKAHGEVDPDTTGLVILDSLRKAVPKRLLDQLMREFSEGTTPGKNDRNGIDGANGRAAMIKAALNAQWADELTMLLDQTGTSMIVIGRETKNSNKKSEFDLDWVLTGGDAIIFEASVQARILESKRIVDDEKRLFATEHAVEIRKTKIAGKEERYPRAYFHLATGIEDGVPYGFDRARDVLALGRELHIIGDGGRYPFEGENLGHGELNALKTLRNDPELLQRIETKCRLAKMPRNALVEVSTTNGPVVVQEVPKEVSPVTKAVAAPRKRAAAGKAQGRGGKGRKR